MNKIAFFHNKFPAGGAETVTFDIASILHRENIEVYVFSHKLELDKFPQNSVNIKPTKLPHPNKDERNYPIILSKIKEYGIRTLVIPNDINYFPFIDRIKQDTGVKVIFVLHSMPFWEYQCKIHNAKRKIKKSFIKKLEWYLFRHLNYKLGFKYNSIRKRYINIYNKVDVFGVLCENYGKELAQKLDIEYSTSKFRVLSNFIREEKNITIDKQKEVYFVGRISYADKRVDRLLEIWSLVEKKHNDWILNIVGEGEELNNLKKLCEELKLERVFFKGFTTNPKEYYDRAAIVCLTSSFEGWGLVLTEAQANGCVAIAFDCSAGVRKILSPSWENGVLIKTFDLEEYSQALSRLMSDNELRHKIAENGRLSIKRFSPENTLNEWKSLLSELT